MSWSPYRSPQNYVVFGGFTTPGVAVVVGGLRKDIYDKKKPSGSTGATVSFEGSELAPFTVEITLDSDEDFEEWEYFRQQVVDRPPGGDSPRPYACEHPVLADLGVAQCVIEERTQLTDLGDGGWKVTLKCLQYRKPEPKRAAVSGSSKRKKKQTPEEDERDRRIRELIAQRDALAGG